MYVVSEERETERLNRLKLKLHQLLQQVATNKCNLTFMLELDNTDRPPCRSDLCEML